MSRKNLTPEQVDALLPQTQCGLCNYKGCLPYAAAIVHEHAALDLCPPGGVKGLIALATLVGEDPNPFIADMEKKAKPKTYALIREDECIGCTKCIQACPVDAILGSSRHMHTVITAECTGCELCVTPCPVDCIDMVELATQTIAAEREQQKADQARKRFQARQKRLLSLQEHHLPREKQSYVQAALLRAKAKKLV